MAQNTQFIEHLTRLGLFDARAPRYTSYPSAPHFSDQIGHQDLSTWISKIPEGAQISLYLHIPFCQRLCWFCACRTQGTQSLSPVLSYVETLLKELALLRQILPKNISLSRLHWGGGTPTLLPADQITRLGKAILAVMPLAPDGEFSVEIDPNELDTPRLEALAKLGMNRASIGVQDFDPLIQAAIGREQSYEITKNVTDALRAHGINSLNTDILFGLPHQTPERIAKSVRQLLSLTPDRVALYGYAHVPWMSRRQQLIPTDAMPKPQERLELFEIARQLFTQAGYVQIGIDHFAKPHDAMARALKSGILRRNFQGYTDDQAQVLLGLGASSISRFAQGYAQNAPATAAYKAAIEAGHFATVKGHRFHRDDLLRGRIIERLMCDFYVDTIDLAQEFKLPPQDIRSMLYQESAAFHEVITFEGNRLNIPIPAQPLARMIARSFDTYSQDKAQHSAAI